MIIDPTSYTSNLIGNNFAIYKHCRVMDTQLGEGATIGDFTTVRESLVGDHSSIQRYCDIWRLNMGRYSCIGRVSTVQATEIGSFCALSWNLHIGGDNHDYKLLSTHPFFHDMSWGIADDKEYHKEYHEWEYRQPCSIGNDVWMGNDVCVNRNVHVGDGCVIGAGAVITKDIEPYSIVVGVPGVVVKKRFSDDIIERLLRLKWWDFNVEIIKDNLDVFKRPLNEEMLEKLEEIKFKLNE